MPGRSPLEKDSGRRGLGTRAVHPPAPPAQDGQPVAPILDPSSTFSFDDSDAFAKASEERIGAGYVYARWANPTIDAFEAAVADLEGSREAEAFASGMAAITAIFLSMCSSGDRIVATRQLYGNTYGLLRDRLPKYGIETELVDFDDFATMENAIEGSKMLYCETIANPRMQVADLDRLALIADGAGVPLVVDNTFASPVLCRPIEHGATLVVHSATKFFGGHHDLMGGIVCGDPAALEPIRVFARDTGGTMAPFNAWLALRGVATIQVRVERSARSALAVARFLEGRADVDSVYYPALDSSPSKELADRLLQGHGGGTLAFEVAGGRDRTARFQEALRLILPAASLGGTHSLIVHAASVTHTQLDEKELEAAGMGPSFCRLSIGLEDADDLIADLDQALDATG